MFLRRECVPFVNQEFLLPGVKTGSITWFDVICSQSLED